MSTLAAPVNDLDLDTFLYWPPSPCSPEFTLNSNSNSMHHRDSSPADFLCSSSPLGFGLPSSSSPYLTLSPISSRIECSPFGKDIQPLDVSVLDEPWLSPVIRVPAGFTTPRPKRRLPSMSPLTPLSVLRRVYRSPTPRYRLRGKAALRSGIGLEETERSTPTATTTPAAVSSTSSYTSRTFPELVIEISPLFPLFYRRFPASSYYQCDDKFLFDVEHPGGNYNHPRTALDLYTPRFTKGRGIDKVGLCPICVEPCERGGMDRKVWLSMKFSAFKCYHMQYGHGISAATARPYAPPLAFRIVPRSSPNRTEKDTIMEGMCHKCDGWVPVEGIKNVEVKVKEMFWWKHAAACHGGRMLVGESESVFEEDEVLERLGEVEK